MADGPARGRGPVPRGQHGRLGPSDRRAGGGRRAQRRRRTDSGALLDAPRAALRDRRPRPQPHDRGPRRPLPRCAGRGGLPHLWPPPRNGHAGVPGVHEQDGHDAPALAGRAAAAPVGGGGRRPFRGLHTAGAAAARAHPHPDRRLPDAATRRARRRAGADRCAGPGLRRQRTARRHAQAGDRTGFHRPGRRSAPHGVHPRAETVAGLPERTRRRRRPQPGQPGHAQDPDVHQLLAHRQHRAGTPADRRGRDPLSARVAPGRAGADPGAGGGAAVPQRMEPRADAVPARAPDVRQGGHAAAGHSVRHPRGQGVRPRTVGGRPLPAALRRAARHHAQERAYLGCADTDLVLRHARRGVPWSFSAAATWSWEPR